MLLFRLARVLNKSVREIEFTFSSAEINEWGMYFQIEPSNSVEVQLALMAQLKAISMGTKNTTLNDYLLTVYKPEKEDSSDFLNDDAVKSIFSSLAIAK